MAVRHVPWPTTERLRSLWQNPLQSPLEEQEQPEFSGRGTSEEKQSGERQSGERQSGERQTTVKFKEKVQVWRFDRARHNISSKSVCSHLHVTQQTLSNFLSHTHEGGTSS